MENKQVNESVPHQLIAGLIRAAELLEGRDRDNGHREIWDTTANQALQKARELGLAVPAPEYRAPEPPPDKPRSFEQELASLINHHCQENSSRTPDFILASYLQDCLSAWNKHQLLRDRWWTPNQPTGEEACRSPA